MQAGVSNVRVIKVDVPPVYPTPAWRVPGGPLTPAPGGTSTPSSQAVGD